MMCEMKVLSTDFSETDDSITIKFTNGTKTINAITAKTLCPKINDIFWIFYDEDNNKVEIIFLP